jgi:predicted nucleic acid-binding protein
MNVADSSYLVEGILRDASLLENEAFAAPDLALYEVVNTLWKHEVLIGDVKNASLSFGVFLDLIANQNVELLRPDKRLLDEAYALSVRHKIPIYDMVFVALALQLGLELRTFDDRQSKILSSERRR